MRNIWIISIVTTAVLACPILLNAQQGPVGPPGGGGGAGPVGGNPAGGEKIDNDFGNFEALGSLLNGAKSIDAFVNNPNPMVRLIGTFLRIGVALIVVAGLIAIVVGGYMYMTAGGDGGRVEKSKTIIASALIGIVLALAIVLILREVNPALVPTVDPF